MMRSTFGLGGMRDHSPIWLAVLAIAPLLTAL
jgi:hypothetical protein